ncbi:MAG: FRG domain-containing protein [Candidatus Eisenbacteria bacterium]|nr:FRG domain-containing protein [Candidatus Eisenbacteria bacterium]
MVIAWETTRVTTVDGLFGALLELRGKGWFFRGQSKDHGSLYATVDRDPMDSLSRAEKLALERHSIETFRSAAKFFATEGERQAMVDDFIALMVLRHYGTPTRLLDWTASPFVAAYFAAHGHEGSDGEIWAFNEPLYESEGALQWREHPDTTIGGTGDPAHFAAGLTAFKVDLRFDWFICVFYPRGFPRQNSQAGAYSLTAQFSQNHAEHIARMLKTPEHYHRYLLPAELKGELLTALREQHSIWEGSLFPDSAGAAATAARLFPKARAGT